MLTKPPEKLFMPGIQRISQNEFYILGGNKDLMCYRFKLLDRTWEKLSPLPQGHLV
jgi:hypothetical protein